MNSSQIYEDFNKLKASLSQNASNSSIQPLQGIEPDEPDNLLSGIATHALGGFIEGFTTIPVTDEPKDTAEGIAQSVGHLLGFMGVIPGLGSVGKLTALGLGKFWKANKILDSIVAGTKVTEKALEFKSVPMLFADAVMKYGTRINKSMGSQSPAHIAKEFLLKRGVQDATIRKAGDILQGAGHLGLASFASAKPVYDVFEGIDERLEALASGAVAGGAFRMFGNLFPNIKQVDQNGTFTEKLLGNIQDPKGMLRILSSSLFMGLPSTLTGDPTELQVYNYLQGALFGSAELSKPEKEAMEFMHGRAVKETYNTETSMAQFALYFPERLKGWSKERPYSNGEHLSEDAQKIVREQMELKGLRNIILTEKDFQNEGLFKDLYESSQNKVENGVAIPEPLAVTLDLARRLGAEKLKEAEMEIDPKLRAEKLKQITDSLMGIDIYKKHEERYKDYESKYLKDVDNKSKAEADIQRELYDLNHKALMEILSEESVKIHDALQRENIERQNYNEEQLKEFLENNYDMDERSIQEGQKYILENLKIPLYNPVKEMAYEIVAPLKNTRDYGVKYVETIKGITDTIKSHLKENTTINLGKEDQKTLRGDWRTLFSNLEKKYNVDLSPSTVDKANPMFQKMKQALNLMSMEPIRQGYYDLVNGGIKLYEAGRTNEKGVEKISWKDVDMFYKREMDKYYKEMGETGSDYFEVDTISWFNPDMKAVEDIPLMQYFRNDTDFKKRAQFLRDIYRDGNFLVFGAKDSGKVAIQRRFPNLRNKMEAKNYLMAVRRALPKDKVKAFDMEFRKTYEYGNKDPMDKEIQFVTMINNMKRDEILMGRSIHEIYQMKGKGVTLRDAVELNKRTSLFINGFKSLTPADFAGLKDYDTDGKFKILLLSRINRNDLPRIAGIGGKGFNWERSFAVKDEKGNIIDIIERPTTTHLDGSFLMRNDAYDMYSNAGGLDLDTGAQKGTIVATGFLGKLAFHRTDKALNDVLHKLGAHGFIVAEDSAKLFGENKPVDLQYNSVTDTYKVYDESMKEITGNYAPKNKDKEIELEFETELSTKQAEPEAPPVAFDSDYRIYLDPRDITVTNTGEHPYSMNKAKKYNQQMITNLNHTMPNAMRFFEEKLKGAVTGETVTNRLIEKALNSGSESDIDAIDFDKAGVEHIYKIINNPTKHKKLFKKLINEINQSWASDSGGMGGFDQDKIIDRMMSDKSDGMQRITELVDLTPEIIESKLFSKAFQKRFTQYLLDKITQPMALHSYQSVIGGVSPKIQAKWDIAEGTGVVGADFGKRTLDVYGRKMTFREALKEEAILKKSLQDKSLTTKKKAVIEDKLKQLDQKLTVSVVRVPMDSNSGFRSIRIKGIENDVRGTQIYLNKRDMDYLGGADTDIDKAFIYTDIPEEVKAEYKQYEDMFEDYYTKKDDKWIKLSKEEGRELFKKGKAKRVFIEQTELTDAFLKKDKYGNPMTFKHGKRFMGKFDPYTLLEVAESAYYGKTLLGKGVSETQAMNTLANSDYALKSLKVDLEELARGRTSLVNSSADASNGMLLADTKEVSDAIRKLLYKGDDEVVLKNLKTAYTAVKNIKKAMDGFDPYYEKMDFPSVVKQMTSQFKSLESTPFKIMNPLYRIMKDVSLLNIEFGEGGKNLYESALKTTEKKFTKWIKGKENYDKILGRTELSFFNNGFLKGRFYNQRFVEDYDGGQWIDRTPHEKAQLKNELLSQDMADRTSAVLILSATPKEYDVSAVEGIRDNVWELKKWRKDTIKRLMKEKDVKKIKISMSAVRKEMDSKILQLKNLTDKKYHSLIDAYLLSSLRPSSDSLRNRIMKANEANIFRLKELEAKPNKTDYDKILMNDLQNAVEIKQMEVINKYFDSNIDSAMFSQATISDRSIAEWGRIFNDLADVQKKGMPQNQLEAIKEGIYAPKGLPKVEYNTSVDGLFLQALQLGNKEIEIPEKLKSPLMSIESFFKKFPHLLPRMQNILEGVINKNTVEAFGRGIDTITEADIIKIGKVLQDMVDKNRAGREIKKTDYMQLTDTIAEDLSPYDVKFEPVTMPIMTSKGDLVVKTINTMGSWLGGITKFNHRMGFLADKYINEETNKLKDSQIMRMVDYLNQTEHGLGEKLHIIAMAKMESQIKHKDIEGKTYTPVIYKERFEQVRGEYEALKDKVYKVDADTTMKGSEIVKKFIELNRPEFNNWMVNFVKGENAQAQFFNQYKSQGIVFDNGVYNLPKMEKALRLYKKSNNPQILGLEFASRLNNYYRAHNLRVDQLDRLNKAVHLINPEKSYGSVEELLKDRKMLNRLSLLNKEGYKYPVEHALIQDILKRYTVEDKDGYLRIKPDFKEEIIYYKDYYDHKSLLSRNMMIYKSLMKQAVPKERELSEFNFDGENYFPHMLHDEKIVDEHLKKILEGTNEAEAQEITLKVKREVQDNTLEGAEYLIEDTFDGSVLETTFKAKSAMMGNILGRERLSHKITPGWALNPEVREAYLKKLISSYHKSLFSFVGKMNIDDMVRRKIMGENSEEWANFGYMYINDNISYSSIYPDEYINNPSMKIKGNPYYYLTDHAHKERILNWGQKHFKGLDGELIRRFRELNPEKLAQMMIDDRDGTMRLLRQYNAIASYTTFKMNQWDAKWNFLSLLTHTKSVLSNMFGGTTSTIISTGFEPYQLSRNFKWLQENIFNEKTKDGRYVIETPDQLNRYVESLAGLDQMFRSEMAFNKILATGKGREFAKDWMRQIRRSGFDENVMHGLAKKHGLFDILMESSAWFMRKAESSLRISSWLSHYIKAREVLQANGLKLPKDDPWLLEFANRGVQATQFLYNNANRPAFARTNLGKIYSRFQLWTWNSLKFRKDLMTQARDAGIDPNTAEFQRARRMLTADIFVLALAGLFPSSLFDNTLAPPFSIFQNLAEFIFGDSKDREKAFYGVLPFPANILQPVLPPSSRLLTQTFNLLVSGDFQKFGDQVWGSWLPFGRLSKSVYRSVTNPITAVDNMTGIPFMRIQKEVTQLKNTDKEEK